MTKVDTKILLNKAQAVFGRLIKDDNSLTRQQVLDILGPAYADYYSVIVSGLAYIEKVTRKIGRTGGIEFKSGKGKQKELLPGNLRELQDYFEEQDVEASNAAAIDDDKEKSLYEPLKEYIERSGLFTIVEIYGENRGGGGKWNNPDLVALTYSASLKYHFGIFPKLTAFEVKYHWPGIRDLQQAASYLRYFHSAYLCFYDPAYTGKRFDALTTKLRDDEIWDWSTIYNVGLIAAFAKQKRSTNMDFQIIKEASVGVVEPETVEDSIDTYFSKDAWEGLIDAIKEQIKEVSFKTRTSYR